jgi:phosphoglycerate dehydrogenase-like enzyme
LVGLAGRDRPRHPIEDARHAEGIEAALNLVRAIGAFCIGTNQIDLEAASERGVTVFNAPFSNTPSVVELALSEVIALTRRLTEKNQLMHDGVWDKSADNAHEVRGRSLGIVGYGNIGSQLSVLAENLGMRVVSTTWSTSWRSAMLGAVVRSTSCLRSRRRDIARRRPAVQCQLLRTGGVRRDASGQPVHEPVSRICR